MDEPFFSIGDGLRRMYLESPYDTVEEFLASLEVPDAPAVDTGTIPDRHNQQDYRRMST